MATVRTLIFVGILMVPALVPGQSKALVFQSDFGLKDGAVSAMKGVAYSVSGELHLFDITHEIPPYDIREAAYRLKQAAVYWPAGTVFVSVVDPGVGSGRKSIVMKSRSGHYFVSPDNGTLTLVAVSLGVAEVREIDETRNRLKGSQQSYTFHGRDVYAYTGARLASGIIRFEEVGKPLQGGMVTLEFPMPAFTNGTITGTVDIIDVQYGNIWTNIDAETLSRLPVKYGEKLSVQIKRGNSTIYKDEIPFGRTFNDVEKGKVVAYLNSLGNFSLGINQGDFSSTYKVRSGDEWTVLLSKK